MAFFRYLRFVLDCSIDEFLKHGGKGSRRTITGGCNNYFPDNFRAFTKIFSRYNPMASHYFGSNYGWSLSWFFTLELFPPKNNAGFFRIKPRRIFSGCCLNIINHQSWYAFCSLGSTPCRHWVYNRKKDSLKTLSCMGKSGASKPQTS